ncbi:MAG: DUF1887 family protein [Clostridiales bacterium]|nr:DUF1887 family protein [Clostridiales bacterium]
MKTLIELYDERPLENVLGTEMFRPEEMIMLCPPEAVSDKALRESLSKYFEYRGCQVKLTMVPVSLLDAAKVEKQLRTILETHEDCAIDISGGTDASLFAAGTACGDTPVFTYSHSKNSFFEIQNAPFARSLPCNVTLDARSCFLMAGGTLLPGREDNEELKNKLPQIDLLFAIFRKYRRIWRRQIGYMQAVSSSEPGVLSAEGEKTVKVDHGRVTADEELLRELSGAGLIRNLQIEQDRISFEFPDEVVRFWLRDIGSVLELQVYSACLEAGCYDDVVLSAVVNWEGGSTQRNAVTNEIDVVAVQGIEPVFISCKTSDIRTEALNELAILRDRFGGRRSRAIIVTSAPANRNRALMRMRAAELNIEVIELGDLTKDRLVKRLKQEI